MMRRLEWEIKTKGRTGRRAFSLGLMAWASILCLAGLSHRAEATCTAGLNIGPTQLTFSGTNCSLSAWVSTTVGYITDGTIYIGGEPTATFHNDDITKTLITFGVAWDSTHFAHDSSVQLLVVGRNSQGQEGRSNRIFQDKIHNKGSVFSHHEFQAQKAIVTLVSNNLTAMQHAITTASGSNWTEKNVLDSVKVDTALHYSTHGAPTQMQVDAIEAPDADGWITSGQVSAARQQRTTSVPIRLVFLNGCQSFSFSWYTAFGIWDNVTDQAFVGWDQNIHIKASQEATVQFWDWIKGKNIVGDEAHPEANPPTQATGAIKEAQWVYDHDPDRGILFPATLKSHGDTQTKLRGVYGGSGSAWWR